MSNVIDTRAFPEGNSTMVRVWDFPARGQSFTFKVRFDASDPRYAEDFRNAVADKLFCVGLPQGAAYEIKVGSDPSQPGVKRLTGYVPRI